MKLPATKHGLHSLGLSCALFLVVACAHTREKPEVRNVPNSLRAAASIVVGKSVVFCLKGDPEIKRRLEAETVKKMQSQGFDATEGRHIIPPSDSYSAGDLAIFLRGAGFRSIAEITYGDAVTSAAPDIAFHWFTESGEKHYSTTRMGLDAALRNLIDSLGSNQKRD